MGTMLISLPESLKAFVDEQVDQGGYSTISEYVCELIRLDQDRVSLRALVVNGSASAAGQLADEAYFRGLRERMSR